jgi:hypothetical protein
MLNLSIDMHDYVDRSSLSDEEVNGFKGLLLQRLAKAFNDKWEDQIKNLHSTRAEYRLGMFVDTPDDNSIVMGVTARQSKLAVDLELGKDAFDEKQGFAMSPKRHEKKNGGWFITVPFRFSTSAALGESSAFSASLPEAVERIAKKQNTPVRNEQLPLALQVRTVRPEIHSGGRVFKEYKHKASIYEGLIRAIDTDENRGQYRTYRRVSDLSDANSWIHPGFLPHNFLGKALDQVIGKIPDVVREAKVDYFGSI